jgi:hypothetical protein
MSPTNVELHIEELVLDGFDAADCHRIAEAVEHELARLFVEEDVPPSLSRGKDVGHLDGGAFEVGSGLGPEAVGVRVARAIHGGLSA